MYDPRQSREFSVRLQRRHDGTADSIVVENKSRHLTANRCRWKIRGGRAIFPYGLRRTARRGAGTMQCQA